MTSLGDQFLSGTEVEKAAGAKSCPLKLGSRIRSGKSPVWPFLPERALASKRSLSLSMTIESDELSLNALVSSARDFLTVLEEVDRAHTTMAIPIGP